MIKSVKHKGLEKFFKKGTVAGIQAKHRTRLADQLAVLNAATQVKDLDIAGYRLHSLSGSKKNRPVRWAITFNGNWRLTFEFRDGDFFVIDYEDYY